MSGPAGAAGLLMVGFDGTEPSDELRDFFAGGPPAGIILFGRNIVSTSQVARLIQQLRKLWPEDGPTPLIAVDQEGGKVRRLKAPECPDFAAIPDMADFGRVDEPALSFDAGRVMGAQLAALGFNLNFAPVLDVDTEPANPIINTRAFGREVEGVIRHALSMARGLQAAGVLPCGKHFPGHGDTRVDSHLGLPNLPHDRARLEAVELAPFAAAVAQQIPSLMSAHIVFESLDPTRPATLSPTVIPELLRRGMGFDGVLFSDDLEMAAVANNFSITEVAEGGLDATIDLFLVCRQLSKARALRDALERACQKSQSRAAAAQLSLARIQKLRDLAVDQASTPFAGTLPCTAEAQAVMERLAKGA